MEISLSKGKVFLSITAKFNYTQFKIRQGLFIDYGKI